MQEDKNFCQSFVFYTHLCMEPLLEEMEPDMTSNRFDFA